MIQYFPIIKKCPLFKDMNDSELTDMLTCLDARVTTYSKNQTIFREGDPARYVGIVLSGEVEIAKTDFYGSHNIIARIEVSQIFGEAFACAGIEKLPVAAAAVYDSTVLLIACRRIITTCSNSCQFHNQMIANLLQMLAAKNILLNQKIELTSKRTTKDKLMAYLLTQAKENKNSIFAIPYDRQGLADYLGVERSAMSAELSKLRKDGKIDFYKNQFRIL